MNDDHPNAMSTGVRGGGLDYGHRTVTEQVRALDIQIGGDHYKSMPIQPMEFSMANGLDACQHTVIKYVTRFRVKGGVEDLRKAKHVIDLLIEFEERNVKRT